MRRWGRVIILGIAAAAAIAVLPAGASAKPHLIVSDPGFEAGLHLQGSHGYELAVTASGHKRVTLTASKGSSFVSYTAPGRATSRRINANFGSLGRVSVRLENPAPRRKEGGFPLSCRGRKPIRKTGTFHGTIRFRGEGGFTAVDADNARGGFRKSFRRVCGPPGSKKRRSDSRDRLRAAEDPFLTSLLQAKSNLDGRSTEFAIIRLEAGKGEDFENLISFVIAEQRERLGRIQIGRGIFTDGGDRSLLASPPGVLPVEATVNLARPFFGSASFHEDAGLPPTWTGTFGVSLPGAPGIPLTGESFRAGYCRSASERVFDRCLRGLEEQGRTSAQNLRRLAGALVRRP
jgi:hypothetical protein